MKLVRNGYGWSGHERNRFFLNGRKGSFHEMSHLAGLDHPEDGRGLAIVDWDQDGRLDLCYRNRNAPRLRLMMNRRDAPGAIVLKLEGTTVNRDAIGAVVELLPAEDKQRLLRTVKAGDLFLSQSSKMLHFGVGKSDSPRAARVTWPGGTVETFGGLKPGRFLLKEGQGKALPLPTRAPLDLPAQPMVPVKPAPGARILLPARVPFPTTGYRNPALKPQKLRADGQARLLVLWSASCPTCQGVLEDLTAEQGGFQEKKLQVMALAVEGTKGPGANLAAAYEAIDRFEFPFPWGLLDKHSAEEIHRFQEQLFDRTPPPEVPLAILLDGFNQALALYRGHLDIATILGDFETLHQAHPVQLYHLAPPLSGTWFTNPLPPREVHRLFGAPGD